MNSGTQGYADHPSSFSKAKKLVYNKVYKGHKQTFYCGCDYRQKKVNFASCGYKPRNNARRAQRAEIAHVIPPYWLANLTDAGRECWKEGGRKHCLKSNPQFKKAHNDLMNLVPAIGEIKDDRSNYKYGIVSGEERAYGSCDMEITLKGRHSRRRVEPPMSVRGDIARIYFYMAGTYDLELPYLTHIMLDQWDLGDPLDQWEMQRNSRIFALQAGK